MVCEIPFLLLYVLVFGRCFSEREAFSFLTAAAVSLFWRRRCKDLRNFLRLFQICTLFSLEVHKDEVVRALKQPKQRLKERHELLNVQKEKRVMSLIVLMIV
jgi:predicted membrane protein